jgi:probable HAF family extracellular repeat protein
VLIKTNQLGGVIMKAFQGLSFNQTNSTILKPALFSAALLFASVSTNAATYDFTDFGANSIANGINNVGQVVGASNFNGSNATLWNGTTATNLGTLGGIASRANAINDSGQIVGYSYIGNNTIHATVWNGNVISDLGTLGGVLSIANDINNRGQIVGISGVVNPNGGGDNGSAVLWANSTLTNLGTLGSPSYASANGINDLGQIAGESNLINNSATRATLWNGGTLTDLGALAGGTSFANSINNAGQVVGYSYLTNNTNSMRATLWEGGTITDLGTLNGGTSEAKSINELGQIVGISDGHGFLWENGVMTDLNSLVNLSLGLTIVNAKGINDFGWIVGDALDINGFQHGYVLSITSLSNVPVPAAAWLFASGLGAFGVAKCRSKKA